MVCWHTFDPDWHLKLLDNLDIGNMKCPLHFASINEGLGHRPLHLVRLNLGFFHILLLREGSGVLSSLSDGCPP